MREIAEDLSQKNLRAIRRRNLRLTYGCAINIQTTGEEKKKNWPIAWWKRGEAR